jgi:hypothetical protein
MCLTNVEEGKNDNNKTPQCQGDKWQDHKYSNENAETTTPMLKSTLMMPPGR